MMKRLITACHFAAAQALLHAASTPRRVATRREAYIPPPAATVAAGAANLAFYQLQMSRRERRGADSWRKTQAAARVDWCRHVFATEGWLYAVQTLRNGITANTFQAATVLTLGGLSVGQLKQASHVQVASVVCCLVASAYTFSQIAPLILHASFCFPVAAVDPQQRAAVEKIMVRSHRLQWMGWRWLYHVAWPVAWLAGGRAGSLGASLALTLFFAREDRAPVAS